MSHIKGSRIHLAMELIYIYKIYYKSEGSYISRHSTFHKFVHELGFVPLYGATCISLNLYRMNLSRTLISKHTLVFSPPAELADDESALQQVAVQKVPFEPTMLERHPPTLTRNPTDEVFRSRAIKDCWV